ncbi:cysteine dioxygenase family protein [Streptomyces oryzae]|nr:cysteine dioxygenase family protein [Streptomyces oryzae]
MTATTTTPSAARTTGRMRALIEDVREAVGRGLPPDVTAYLVGEKLTPHLGADDLLTGAQCEPDPGHYRQHVLHAESDGSFSVVALVWLPGQGTSIHDHVSWCVTGVHRGEEHERRYRLLPSEGAGGSARLVATEDVVNPQGSVCGFAPPGDIHRVWNGCTAAETANAVHAADPVHAADAVAVSLHIYGADISRLGSSVRRVYDLPADA